MTPVEPVKPKPHGRILWQRRFAASLSKDALVLADGLVLCGRQADTMVLYRLDGATGHVRWVESLNESVTPPLGLLRCGDQGLTLLRDGTITQTDLTTGRMSKHVLDGDVTGSGLGRADHAFLQVKQGDQNSWVRWNTRSQTVAWSAHDPTSGGTPVFLNVAGARLIMAWDQDDHIGLTALDIKTGTPLWRTLEVTGRLLDLWCLCDRLDVVSSQEGVLGIDTETGAVRNRRFRRVPFTDGRLAGDCFLAVFEEDGHKLIRTFNALVGPALGDITDGFGRLIGAHCGEALIAGKDEQPELRTLPHLSPVMIPDMESIGPIKWVHWARDTAYLVGNDTHMVTAIELPSRSIE
jgi:outer membrane protein assembly factor BamB